MSVIEEVKQKTDIVEVIGQYVTLKKAGRNLTALCPFHSEKTPSFVVYPEQQSWHCFGACGTGGDVFSFLMKKESIDFGEALRRLAEKAGVTLPTRTAPDANRDAREALYKINDAAAVYFNNLLLNSPGAKKARDYIARRGFTPQTVADFQLGFSLDSWEALRAYLKEKNNDEAVALAAGLLVEGENGKVHDRFRGKLMIPIRDIRGRVTGFGARVLDDSFPKYVNSPQTPVFDKSGTLYGLDRAAAAIRRQDAAIIMEGYMDVITAHQNGITNVVASMGTAITETQVNILKKLSRNLVLSLDADTAGEEAMLRGVGYENTLNAEIRVVILPEGKDPDEVIREDAGVWHDYVNKAVPIVDYTFEKVSAGLDLNTARDKSLLVERLLPVIAAIQDPVRQAHYMQKLGRAAQVTERTLEAALNRLHPAAAKRRTVTEKAPAHARPGISRPREEYCLALLLQYPELRSRQAEIPPEYFAGSENREILDAWRETGDPEELRERLAPAIAEHLDTIINKSIIKSLAAAEVDKRFEDCILELEKEYYRSFEAKRAEILALAAASDGAGADLARLVKEGIEPSTRLKEVFAHKKKGR